MIEQKTTPEKDKLGQWGVLVWMPNRDVSVFKDQFKKIVDDAPDKNDSMIKLLAADREILQDIWKQLNP